MIDRLLRNIVGNETGGHDVAILMSGGTDSCTLLFTALRLGKKVHCYTFRPFGQDTYDSTKAKEICDIFNVPITIIDLPEVNLVNDFKLLASKYNCKKKTQYECTWPYIYTFPIIKEKYILSGLAADGYYGVSKKAMIHFRHTLEKMQEFRKSYFKDNPNPAGYLQLKQFCEEYNKILCVPYLDDSIYNYFYTKTWEDINKPYQKHLIQSRFDEFKKIKIKGHINYQLCAKVDKLFEKLLDNKEINLYNRKRVMDICRDWYNINQSKANLENFL